MFGVLQNTELDAQHYLSVCLTCFWNKFLTFYENFQIEFPNLSF